MCFFIECAIYATIPMTTIFKAQSMSYETKIKQQKDSPNDVFPSFPLAEKEGVKSYKNLSINFLYISFYPNWLKNTFSLVMKLKFDLKFLNFLF